MGGNNYGGGYAYMVWKTCACGRKFIVGNTHAKTEHKCPPCRKGLDGTPKRLKQQRERERGDS